MIEELAKLIPSSLEEESGSVFYSGKNAFTGQKDLYIVGLNPGGSDIRQKAETIAWHTNKVLSNDNRNFSEYKDGRWRDKEAGTSRLQRRILYLLDQVSLSPYAVPASNICFVRSPREENIADRLKEYAELCWPFHEGVINQLGVKVILCFGKTAGKLVRKKIGADKLVDEFVENNDRKWKSEAYQNESGQTVIIATHPSIADWTNEKTDISPLVKKYLKVPAVNG